VDARVVIIGAGPQGLAVTARLLAEAPAIADELCVLDPSGTWLSAWDGRFRRLAITHLRSPGVHHPHPDPYALLERTDHQELHGRYRLPSAAAFEAFCRTVIDDAGAADLVRPGTVADVAPLPRGARCTLADGRSIDARHVVVACGIGAPQRPAWAAPSIPHSEDVDLGAAAVDGARVAVVGGGLTAHQLVRGARAGGAASVALLSRRRLRASMFDTDPGWLGPKRLDDFEAEPDAAIRRQMIRDARDGGSIPPPELSRLQTWVHHGEVSLVEADPVRRADPLGDGWVACTASGHQVHADVVWLATGYRPDVASAPLGSVRRQHPVPEHLGLPELARDLRWPGTSVHVVGSLAGLRLGPTAGNLSGARRAAARVARTVLGAER
jgi:hypothetical protein